MVEAIWDRHERCEMQTQSVKKRVTLNPVIVRFDGLWDR
jgi:hypothetical protein